jgi:hypothetical protein
MNIQWFRKLFGPLILTLVCYFLFCTNIYMKKEAQAMEKAILANIPNCLRAKSQA